MWWWDCYEVQRRHMYSVPCAPLCIHFPPLIYIPSTSKSFYLPNLPVSPPLHCCPCRQRHHLSPRNPQLTPDSSSHFHSSAQQSILYSAANGRCVKYKSDPFHLAYLKLSSGFPLHLAQRLILRGPLWSGPTPTTPQQQGSCRASFLLKTFPLLIPGPRMVFSQILCG